jgi:hypothetical protein
MVTTTISNYTTDFNDFMSQVMGILLADSDADLPTIIEKFKSYFANLLQDCVTFYGVVFALAIAPFAYNMYIMCHGIPEIAASSSDDIVIAIGEAFPRGAGLASGAGVTFENAESLGSLLSESGALENAFRAMRADLTSSESYAEVSLESASLAPEATRDPGKNNLGNAAILPLLALFMSASTLLLAVIGGIVTSLSNPDK